MNRGTRRARIRAKIGSSGLTERTPNRVKLSTTVAAENLAYLGALVSAGRTGSIAEAVDLAIARLRREENRARLERATAAYFEGLSADTWAEERDLAHQLHVSTSGLDFDCDL